MTSPASFVASPGKRIAAFIFDCFASTLLYLVAVAVSEPLGQDLSTFRAFLVVYFIYQFAFVAFRRGSTPGKEVQSICVLSTTGQAPSQWQSLLRASVRLALLGILTIELREWVLPEALIKFSCLAGFGLLALADLALLHNSPTRQTVTDRIAGTLVANLPSPEPHRAPAVPMYSATDAEFGTPPKAGQKHGGRSET